MWIFSQSAQLVYRTYKLRFEMVLNSPFNSFAPTVLMSNSITVTECTGWIEAIHFTNFHGNYSNQFEPNSNKHTLPHDRTQFDWQVVRM